MQNVRVKFSFACFLALGAAFGSAQYLLVPNSSRNRIELLSAQDGSILNNSFISNAAFGTVIAPLQVGSELWFTDQGNNTIYRYSATLTPTLLGSISTGISDVRGASIVGNEVWVANNGTANGAPGPSIARFNFSGGSLGYHSLSSAVTGGTRSPWGIVQAGNRVLVSESTGEDILSLGLDGSYQGLFVNGVANVALNFPQQMIVEGSSVYVAGFSVPTGVYRYGLGAGVGTSGLITNHTISGSLGPRGIHRLGNGNMLASGGTRLVSMNLTTGTDTDIINDFVSSANFGSYRHITAFTPVPEPATMAAVGLGALALLKRRRN